MFIFRDQDNDSHGGECESWRGRTSEDRNLWWYPTLRWRSRPLSMVSLYCPFAFHLCVRVSLFHAILHHITTKWTLVHRARTRTMEPHGRRKVSETSYRIRTVWIVELWNSRKIVVFLYLKEKRVVEKYYNSFKYWVWRFWRFKSFNIWNFKNSEDCEV